MINQVRGNLIKYFIKKRYSSTIDLYKKIPLEMQNKLFFKLLDRAKNTFYGQSYQFASIKTYEEFNSKIPLCKYEELEPFIAKAREGQENILWPSKIKWFAKSSGTTNAKSKFIPVTKECMNDCHYEGGRDLLSNYVYNHKDSKIFSGKTLKLGGSYEINKNLGSFQGDLSSILIENLPPWANWVSAPSKEIALIESWEIKLELMIKQVMNQDIRALIGAPSWMLLFLNRILEVSKKKYIDEIWPNIEVFFHGAVSFSPYVEQYKSLFKKDIRYYEVYNASEGFFALQDKEKFKDLLLLADLGIFYEFIPMEEFDKPNPLVIPLGKVKLGQNYALVISTNTGLWRYIIGDTVKFTNLFPYRILITGRTKHFINAFGEELIIENAELALRQACKATGALISEYTAGPVYMKKDSSGAHEWIIEFSQEPDSLEKFSTFLDNALKALNSDYEAKRYKDLTLHKPLIRIARKDLFYDWMSSRGKLGGQNKVPRLANNREYLDSLVQMNKINNL